MEIVYPPRNGRDHLDETPHRDDDYMAEIRPLLEEKTPADKSDAEYTNDVSSLLKENAHLRGLVVKLSTIILRNVADQR